MCRPRHKKSFHLVLQNVHLHTLFMPLTFICTVWILVILPTKPVIRLLRAPFSGSTHICRYCCDGLREALSSLIIHQELVLQIFGIVVKWRHCRVRRKLLLLCGEKHSSLNGGSAFQYSCIWDYFDCTHVKQKIQKYFNFWYGNIFPTIYSWLPLNVTWKYMCVCIGLSYDQFIERVSGEVFKKKKTVGFLPSPVPVFNPGTQ